MILPSRPQDSLDSLLRGVRRRRRLARMALVFERVWPAVWPAFGVLGVFLCTALLDLPRALPGWAHAIQLAVFALATVLALVRGLRRLVLPDAVAADRRLERATGLVHRPLAVLTDRPAQPGGEVLWRVHLARAMAQVGRLRVGRPSPGMAGRDPRALRLGLVVALAASLGIAGEQAPGRVARSLVPLFTPPTAPPPTLVQAWITPPGYTGMAPVFLKPEGGTASVPAGSRLAVSLTGGTGIPELSLAGAALPFRPIDAISFQAEEELTTGGRLAIRRDGRMVAGWNLTVVANVAPEVSFPEAPGTTRGRVPLARLPWQVSHAYGVVALQAELVLRDRADATALLVPIPLPGGSTRTAKGARVQDLTAHPWAGLPVTARLVARDAPGLSGTSATETFDLPERRFQHPVARSLMEVRKALSRDPGARPTALRELDRLATLEEVWQDDPAGYLNLRGIAGQLRRDRSPGAVDEAQSRMWQLALHLEEGAPERTARALEQARQALREIMEAERQGERIDPAELDRRMREVQEALQRHLQALAEQNRRDPDASRFDPEKNRLDTRDMQKLSEQMRDAAREGRMDEARERLAELERMIEEMKNARPERGKMTERQKQRAEKRQRGQQQMNALQDMVRREGTLLDHAQTRAGQAEPQRGYMQPRPPPVGPDDRQQQLAERSRDQSVQQALRRALGELMQQHGDLTGKVPPNLGEADGAMREAIQAMRDARDPAAAAAVQRVIEALQKGGRQMNQQMAQQFGRPGEENDDGEDGDGDREGDGAETADGDQDGQGSGPGSNQLGPGEQRADRRGDRRGDRAYGRGRSVDRRADDRRDPLGRYLKEGTSGTDESGDVQVPDQMEEARTRAIQEELRRRGAERTRPQPELDYIDRLLRQF